MRSSKCPTTKVPAIAPPTPHRPAGDGACGVSCISPSLITTGLESNEIVAGFKKAGTSVLIASHDPIVYGAALADLVIEMRDGRIMGAGTSP